MKTTITIFLLILIVITGCSNKHGFERGSMSEEERQQMFGEGMQQMSEVCEGLNEGDPCQFETPRGKMEGTCQIREDNLICMGDMHMGDRPMGQRPE